MKKTLVSALTTALVVGAASTTFAAANPFADVPADHWAYDAVAQLVQDGVINGYAVDGTYRGDQNMSRYEMAQIVAKAMAKSEAADNNNKALIDKLAAEFSDELANLGVRVADLEAKTDNVKWQGLIRYDWNTMNFEANGEHRKPEEQVLKLRFEPSMAINENWTGHARLDYNITSAQAGNNVEVSKLWAEGQYGKFNAKLGRFGSFSDNSHGLVMDADVSGAELTYAPTENWKVKATAGHYYADTNLAENVDHNGHALYLAGEVDYQNGKWDAGVGYHRVSATYTNQGVQATEGAFQVVDFGAGYAFDKNVKLTADYAIGSGIDNVNSISDDYGVGTSSWQNASNNAYSIQVDYKGADAAQPGSWGAYVAYRSLSPFAAFEATYDQKNGLAGLKSLKGWEIGADYAFAKNIVGTAKYFNGKDTLLSNQDKATGVWTRVDFLF